MPSTSSETSGAPSACSVGVASGGVGVGYELVVGEGEAEDVRVDHDDGARVGAVAYDVGVEAVDGLLCALGLAVVDGALGGRGLVS